MVTAIQTISGEIQAQPLNDNFSFLNQTINDYHATANVTLYVNPAIGDDSNTGLSAAEPLLTISGALGKVIDFTRGDYIIELAAGTYSGALNKNLLTTKIVKSISINGPSIGGGTPTAIIDMESSASYFLFMDQCMEFNFNNLKFINGSSSTKVIWPVRGTTVYAVNVHIDTCNTGYETSHGSYCAIRNGRIENFTTNGAVGEFSSYLQCDDVYISNDVNGGSGVLYTKYGTGQVRGGTINNCNTGVQLDYGSYAHIGNSQYGLGNITISNCTYGLYAVRNSNLVNATAQITYSANGTNKLVDAATFCNDITV